MSVTADETRERMIRIASGQQPPGDGLVTMSAADSGDGDVMLRCSKATMDGLHAAVPGLKDAHPHDKLSRVLQHLRSSERYRSLDQVPEPNRPKANHR